jgi:hypothetical protein
LKGHDFNGLRKDSGFAGRKERGAFSPANNSYKINGLWPRALSSNTESAFFHKLFRHAVKSSIFNAALATDAFVDV